MENQKLYCISVTFYTVLCEWGNPSQYLDQPIAKGWCQPIRGRVSRPTDSPTATRLGLCSSLNRSNGAGRSSRLREPTGCRDNIVINSKLCGLGTWLVSSCDDRKDASIAKGGILHGCFIIRMHRVHSQNIFYKIMSKVLFKMRWQRHPFYINV